MPNRLIPNHVIERYEAALMLENSAKPGSIRVIPGFVAPPPTPENISAMDPLADLPSLCSLLPQSISMMPEIMGIPSESEEWMNWKRFDEDGCAMCHFPILKNQTVRAFKCGHNAHGDCFYNYLQGREEEKTDAERKVIEKLENVIGLYASGRDRRTRDFQAELYNANLDASLAKDDAKAIDKSVGCSKCRVPFSKYSGVQVFNYTDHHSRACFKKKIPGFRDMASLIRKKRFAEKIKSLKKIPSIMST